MLRKFSSILLCQYILLIIQFYIWERNLCVFVCVRSFFKNIEKYIQKADGEKFRGAIHGCALVRTWRDSHQLINYPLIIRGRDV